MKAERDSKAKLPKLSEFTRPSLLLIYGASHAARRRADILNFVLPDDHSDQGLPVRGVDRGESRERRAGRPCEKHGLARAQVKAEGKGHARQNGGSEGEDPRAHRWIRDQLTHEDGTIK
jgi:hypothetical protein